MANLSAIKLPNGTTYNLKDNGALQLTGGQVTGPVTFGDSVSIDEATLGDLVVNGSASFTNNIQANTINGVTVGSSPKFTDTDTKVTSSANHYTPATASGNDKTASASGATAAWSIDVVKGITINTDGKGHITGLSVTSGKIPANPNTNTTYTFANGTNGFTVTPSGGTAQTVTVTPSITNNITGSGTSGYIAKFNGANTITNGPAFGSGTTKFLREDGTWQVPAYIANTDIKLQVAEVTSATQYYPIVGTGTTAATRQYDTTGFKYKGTTGTTSAVGSAILELGNSTASGTAGNKQAQLIMYGSNAKKATITLAAPSADIALALPTSGGTLALTSQLPSVPTTANSATTGISIAAHSSTSIYGVKSTTTTASKASGGNGSAPSLSYTARSVGSASGWSQGSFTAEVSSHVLSFTFVKPTLTVSSVACDDITAWSAGSASTWSFTDITVPIRNDSTTTVVTSTGHTVTDPGHTHTLS